MRRVGTRSDGAEATPCTRRARPAPPPDAPLRARAARPGDGFAAGAPAEALRAERPGLGIMAVPGPARHSIAGAFLAAGRLDGVLHRAAFGDFADGGLW